MEAMVRNNFSSRRNVFIPTLTLLRSEGIRFLPFELGFTALNHGLTLRSCTVVKSKHGVSCQGLAVDSTRQLLLHSCGLCYRASRRLQKPAGLGTGSLHGFRGIGEIPGVDFKELLGHLDELKQSMAVMRQEALLREGRGAVDL